MNQLRKQANCKVKTNTPLCAHFVDSGYRFVEISGISHIESSAVVAKMNADATTTAGRRKQENCVNKSPIV
jgi:hypothetical protein